MIDAKISLAIADVLTAIENDLKKIVLESDPDKAVITENIEKYFEARRWRLKKLL